ncbi:uncharacterized protein LOC144916574 [Branchiostoma floridae x Branchiostoma belcheri]
MSEFLGFNVPPEEDIYSEGRTTRRNSAVGERFYSWFGSVPNKPTTPKLLSGISQLRKLHNHKETEIFRIKHLESKISKLQKDKRDLSFRISWTGSCSDKNFNNRTMTARVFNATESIKQLHNEREEVIRQLRDTEDQLRGLRRELRDIDRSVNNLMRRLGGIGDAEDVDDVVARRLEDMEQ